MNPEHRIVGAGYNGSYPGGPSCLAGDCPRGRHYWDGQWSGPSKMCACGNGWPCPDAVAPGSSYDTGPGTCINTRAEENAKADAMRHSGGDLDGCTLYVSCQPCEGCIRSIRNTTRIKAIIWPTGAIGLP